jgi:hypothetical protein
MWPLFLSLKEGNGPGTSQLSFAVIYANILMNMIKKTLFNGLLGLLVAVLTVGTASAYTVAQHTWEANDHNWQGDSWLTMSTNTELQFTLPSGYTEFDLEWSGLVWTEAEDFYWGNWQTNMQVAFDFWADDIEPSQVQIWWEPTNAARTWISTPFAQASGDSMATGTWSSLASPNFASAADWGSAGSQAEFLSDLQEIDWIGVYVLRGGDGSFSETYRIDNFSLIIPEPPEMIMIAAALMALVASTVKKKRRDVHSAPV